MEYLFMVLCLVVGVLGTLGWFYYETWKWWSTRN